MFEDHQTLDKQTVVNSLDKYAVEGCDYIIDAFKIQPDKRWISLKKAEEKIEIWADNIRLLDGVNEEVEIEDEQEGGYGDEFDDDEY